MDSFGMAEQHGPVAISLPDETPRARPEPARDVKARQNLTVTQ